MITYLIKRALQAILVLILASFLVFLLTRSMGDLATIMLPIGSTEEQYIELRHELELDKPLLNQYLNWFGDAIHGDLGISPWQHKPAIKIIMDRLPATALLASLATLIAILFAIPLGVIASIRPGSIVDRLCSGLALIGISLPDFWIALMAVLLFSVYLGWFPTSGFGSPKYIILPVLTLAARPVGRIAQMVRSNMIEELQKQYVTSARAKGLPEVIVVGKHVLRNAMLGMITLTGLEFIRVWVGGTVVIETVFAYPGIGQMIIQAIWQRDFILLQAGVMVLVLFVIIVNFLIDIIYGYVNPRVRLTW